MRLKGNLRSTNLEKQQVERYLEEALQADGQLRENRESGRLAALQKAQEVASDISRDSKKVL